MPSERTPWLFEDVHASLSYELEINPKDTTMPSIEKTLTPTPITRGRPVLFQGRNREQSMTLSGTLLTEDQYNALRAWTQTDKQIKVTDDLGRSYWVVFTSFDPRRVRTVEYPWRHEFSISGIVVDWSNTEDLG
jgi:hypothetical protein